jgi:hypothetical protein
VSPRTGRPRKGEGLVADLPRLTVRFHPATRRALDALAERLGLSLNDAVELAVAEAAKRHGVTKRRGVRR